MMIDRHECHVCVRARIQQLPSMLKGCRDVECFERLNKINEGAYGVVFRARDKESGRICALKKVQSMCACVAMR